jgi:DNA-directed RNA polymerase II subunit RPB2
MDNETVWKIIDKYFGDNPQCLVRHQIDSYNDFLKNGIYQMFKDKNQINIQTRFDNVLNEYRSKAILYFGGKDGTRIYFGKPIIYDDDNTHYMFPNEARLRNMTYGITVHYDVEVEIIDILDENEQPTIVDVNNIIDDVSDEVEQDGGVPNRRGKKRIPVELTTTEAAMIKDATKLSMLSHNTQKRTIMLEQILLGRFPIMVQSHHCILTGLPKEVRHTMGECKNDIGGYFIIDGKEKTVVAQEKFGDNMLYIRKVDDEKILYSAEIKSVSENVSKHVRTLSVRLLKPTSEYTMMNIVVNIPNVRKPVPLFIVFRALGIISDKHIITMCLLDLDKYESMIELFRPSIHDSGGIITQRLALAYIATLTKGKTIPHALEILADYLLPHIGEVNYIQKSYYLGYIVFKLLSVHTGLENLPDRDSLKYKRVELVGSLMNDLFREYFSIQQKSIHSAFEYKIHYNQNIYADNLYKLVVQSYKTIFNERIVESGFKKAFKGNWGAYSHTKRVGVIQDLNRLSFTSALSHLRKTNLPLDPSVKVVGPRVLHNTHWGFFDPIDTPDGGNIGLHKQLSISTYVSQPYSREPLIKWLREKVNLKLLEESNLNILSTLSKVFINGYWAGTVVEPIDAVQKIKLFRRNGLIPIYTSVVFDYKQNTIFIYTDGGRICRPIFYVDDETTELSFANDKIKEYLEKDEFNWEQIISGFNNKKINDFDPNSNKIYELSELYENIQLESNPAKLKRFIDCKSIVDYIDTNESGGALIALNIDEYNNTNKKYTHLEIHESFIFGMLCNMINFPENNPAVRNSFSCGQTKQACSLYHTNYQMRMDKTAVVLSYGQTPLVKSRYLEYINNEGNPYGENTIVAVMCYTGYNVEDAILVNQGALNRGLFRTTYFSTYETHEEKTKTTDYTNSKSFTNVENDATVIGTKPGFDYSKLDKYGIIQENTPIDDKTVLIGLTSSNSNVQDVKVDISKTPKKGQLGIVDKTFITEGEEGTRIAKVRVREERIPNLGDKMASRAGQKGTIGLIIKEEDMPFSANGIKPDLIINPHAIPSRMTIGQFVETITGKACSLYGGFGDCTAYNNKGSKIGIYGELLSKAGYHSSGNEILYNGMTGEQLEVEVFMGPNYYMRLKHMVKDKVNFRARGPNTALTRQPVSGRANDGGLRIGEMERDSVISHGATEFLRESMMERGDNYKLAICNITGTIAIVNPSKNLFMSPMADGPVKFISNTNLNEIRIDNISKFGRSFSIVDVPYSLKLLMHELQTINVQMRIITEDNIQQFDNMSFSNNINLLLSDPTITPKMIVNQIKQKLSSNNSNELNTPVIETTKTPEYESPQYNSPQYNSPQYQGDEQGDEPVYLPDTPIVSPSSSMYYDPNAPQTPSMSPPDFNGPQTPSMSPPDFNGPQTPSMSPPDFNGPQTQLMSPQDDNESYKGAGGSSEPYENFSINEPVMYRGDTILNRIWKITNIGDRFITIHTDQTSGFDLDEQIKVVTLVDIYKPTDIPYNSTNIFNSTTPIVPVNNNPTNVPVLPNNNSMNIPPIQIKIVNGNDNTKGNENESIDNPNNNEITFNNNDITEQFQTPTIQVKPSISTDNNSIVENNDNNIFNGGLIIKKI